jgi:imidazolonepropionase-like amidohydrolase
LSAHWRTSYGWLAVAPAVTVAVLIAPALGAQEKPLAIVGARVIPIAGPEIPKGVVVVQKGKIVAVGAEGATAVPAGAVRVDATGKVVMPGIVDTHSHIGSVEGADSSAPIQPDVRAFDSINVRDARIEKARAGGITTANVMPGSGHLLSGQTVYLKLRQGRTIDDLLVPNPTTGLLGGLKMANGTNPRRPKPPFPGTRAKSAALVREQYVKAQEYRQKLKDAGDDPKKRPARDLGLEALVEVLDGKRMVHHHTHRHDDIVTVLRLAKEFGFRVTLHHVSEGWKVADEIAAAGVPCSLTVVDSPGGKLEAADVSLTTAGVLEKAGVTVAFNTDDPITESRFLLRSAALAVRGGMSREGALAGLTRAGAVILDLKDRIGTLEPGKDADFILLSGDPLDYRTHVLETWVEGSKVFDLANAEDRLYAVGGFGAGHDQPVRPHLCGDFDDEEYGR